MEGFVILDYAKQFEHALGRLAAWKSQGKLVQRVTVVPGGLEKAPEALNSLFTGKNIGKMILQVSSEKADPSSKL
jgi:NADPH-dependent curcumin reductase CurA